MRKTVLLIIFAGVAIALTLLLALALYSTASSEARPVPARANTSGKPDRLVLHFPPGAPQLAYLRIAPVEEIPEPAADALPAHITYDEDATARVSSPIAGRVIRLLAKPGDRVTAGQALAWLDAPEYGAAVADLAKARAALERDEQAYKRAKLLFDGGVLARRDLESTTADLAQSRAEERRATGRLKNLAPYGDPAEAGNERYVLRAPISGMLVDRQVNPGSEVRPDAPGPLFVITDPARLWVLADLPENAIGVARNGQRAVVDVDAWPGEHFSGQVAYVGAVLDAASRRVPVRVTLANRDGRLRPEMFGRVTLLADSQKKVIRVPNSAIITEGVNHFVFVEKETGVLEKRAVTTDRQDRDYSILARGLNTGERIVTQGALLLNTEFDGGGQR